MEKRKGGICQIQVGTLWLRDCEQEAAGKCRHCGREICRDHALAHQLEVYCPDCHHQIQKSGLDSLGQKPGFVPRQKEFYGREYAPIYLGDHHSFYRREYGSFWDTDYDVFDHPREEGPPGAGGGRDDGDDPFYGS